VESQEVEDEKDGLHPQPQQVRRLRVRLLLSDQEEHPGYEVLPIARIVKSAEADSIPRLDDTYIPPLLACDASPALQVDILRSIYDRIGAKIDLLAGQVQSRGIDIGSHAFEDARIVTQLRALNEAYTVLNIRAFADGVHPFEAYVDLCRLVGQLAIFDETRRPPDLPRYDHDDLKRFYSVKKYLDDLLNLILEPDWLKRDFKGVALRMEVGLMPEWLEPTRQMFVGVKTDMPPEECVRLLTGQLDMKLGSSDRVDRMYKEGKSCLRFAPRPQPPSLPRVAGLTYFQVDRDAAPEEWKYVQRSYNLAIRLNERRVEGSIEGQEELTIRHAGQKQALRFALFVVKATAPPAPAGS
jgi:type VI secretion system protein ImpJ